MWIWVGARLVVSAMMLLGGGPEAVVRSTLGAPGGTAPLTIVIAMLLGVLDVRIKGERALFGNLGISSPVLAALFAVSAVAGELTLSLVLALA
jgi:hypothetical protein